MNRYLALGALLIGAGVALQFSRRPRRRFSGAIGRRVRGHMERLMASLPDNAPPKLIMSVLPRLREQNDEILALLREQNALLREQRRSR